MKVETEIEFAWLAGLFEGEGSIVNTSKGRSENILMSIASTDEDVIRRVREVVGCGGLTVYVGQRGKPLHRWSSASDLEVRRIVSRIYPFLSQRRKGQVDEALRRRDAYLDGHATGRDKRWANHRAGVSAP